MPTKMRLQRHGKKGAPFYHIVIADGRAPRDGRFIEKIGTYNPIQNPAEIILNAEKALDWLQKGAQPTDTVRAILSYRGILYKNHLLKGVKKGALSEAEAEAKYQTWIKDKDEKIASKRRDLIDKDRTVKKDRLEVETKIKEARADEIAKQRKDVEDAKVKEAQAAVAETEVEKTPAVEEEMLTKEAVADKVEKQAADEAKVEEKAEEKKEETAPEAEAKVEEKVEETKEEVKVEVKVEEKVEEKEVEVEVKVEAKTEAKEEKKEDK